MKSNPMNLSPLRRVGLRLPVLLILLLLALLPSACSKADDEPRLPDGLWLQRSPAANRVPVALHFNDHTVTVLNAHQGVYPLENGLWQYAIDGTQFTIWRNTDTTASSSDNLRHSLPCSLDLPHGLLELSAESGAPLLFQRI